MFDDYTYILVGTAYVESSYVSASGLCSLLTSRI